LLVREGKLDPEDALRLTVWANGKLEAPPAQTFWPPELPAEARRLFEAGYSMPVIAELLVVPTGTVKSWIWHENPSGYRRAGERPRVFAS
jgi:hypothetical protein